MADEFDEEKGELEGVEDSIEALLEECLGAMYDSWSNAASGFNAGQQTIYVEHIESSLDSASIALENNWPWVSVEEDYVDEVSTAYDGDVMERAFSETIYDPVEEMQRCVNRAQALYLAQLVF